MILTARGKRCITPAAVIILAAIGYWFGFQGTRSDPQRLSALIIEHPGSAGLKVRPVSSRAISPSETTWRAVQRAAAIQPDQTGGYSRTWESTKSSSDSMSVLVEVLPTTWDAKLLRKQVLAEYSNAKTLKKEQATVTSRFAVAAVPGAQGVAYQVAASSSTSAGKGTVIAFEVGRAVAMAYVETSTGALGTLDIDAVARTEYALLKDREPSFSLAALTRSALASTIYGLVAVGLAVMAYLAPGLVRRRRARQAAKQAALLRREYRARGSKVLRRRQLSVPQQSGRRRGGRALGGRRWW